MDLIARLAALSMLLVLGSGCERLPFEPRLFPGWYVGPDVLTRTSPIILVGSTVNVEQLTDRGHTIAYGQGIYLQLEKIQVSVEATLKGAVDSQVLEIYRYSWMPHRETDPQMVKSLNPRFVEPDRRYIFFLERIGTYFRTTIDVTEAYLHLSHSRLIFEPTGKPARDIATLLLTEPANKVLADDFTGSLELATLNAITVAGKDWTLRLLLRLLDSSSESIRSETCYIIADRFWGQTSCLRRILSTDLPEEERKRCEDLITRRSQIDASIRNRFLKNPEEFLLQYASNPFTRCNELATLAVFEDPDVRVRASMMLEEEFPRYPLLGCVPE